MSNVLSSVVNSLIPTTPLENVADLVGTGFGIANDVKEGGLGGPIRFYGNWGGPHYGGGQPIDDLDRAFKRHDEGYGERGYFDAATDINFKTEALLNLFNPDASNRERLYGLAATAIFSATTPASIFMTTVYNPIADADSVPEAALNLATAPITTAAAVVTGTANAVGNAISNIFSW